MSDKKKNCFYVYIFFTDKQWSGVIDTFKYAKEAL